MGQREGAKRREMMVKREREDEGEREIRREHVFGKQVLLYLCWRGREVGAANLFRVGVELTSVVGPFGNLASSSGAGARA